CDIFARGGKMNRRLFAALLLCSLAVTASLGQTPKAQSDGQPRASKTNSVPSADEPHVQHFPKRIVEYTLAPELLKKAKTLGAARFAFRVFSFFFSIFAL